MTTRLRVSLPLALLAIVQRVIGGWLADQAGIERASAQCGAVTLIQRFGSALNLRVC